ncbi:metal ABC transporter permease [Leucobacter sp. OH2974_COT-288]|uniref:Manganese/zinc/iron transport system permease protein n=1 Tax=Canibacter oris TaxID=1365628 RepID=A0A840DBL6_9MICO|nr:metal ABC transporter permease [Canibacter oris]MBB4070881.1 manganese/zinc/iron transport system permease protein [Canibacter oris]RRD36593.1 metal ABC transporter permease [Leucobacter sp. OH2974_COT-288]
MSFVIMILLLCVVTAVSCSVPGTYLVAAKRAITVDAISHAMLPGIVFGFLLTQSLTSPLLIAAAVLCGLFTIWAINALVQSKLVAKHSTLGLSLPPLLALAVIVVTLKASDLHLDTHTVLLGDLNLIAFDELCLPSGCYGPKHLYLLLALLTVNLIFGIGWRRQLSAIIFDREFAQLSGVKTKLLHGILLFLTALTITAVFAATGAVLVLAFMILPGAAARLLTHRLSTMLPLAMLFSALAAASGFGISLLYNLPTSAGIAAVMALEFLLVLAIHVLSQATDARRALRHAQ